MQITGLTPKKNDPSYYHVSLDGEYAFTAHEEVVARYHLAVGKELNAGQVQEIFEEALFKKGKERALSLLARRPYARRELGKKLEGDFPPSCVEQVLDKMEELGLLDDREYARRYAHDLYELGQKSLTHIRYALSQRGIDREIVEEALAPYEGQGQEEQIRRVVEKKYRSRLERDPQREWPKVMGALLRMGFPYGEARRVLEEYGQPLEDEVERGV